jgi:PKHD-type hydroxylase
LVGELKKKVHWRISLVNHRYYPLYKEESYKPAICVESFFSQEEIDCLLSDISKLQLRPALIGSSSEVHNDVRRSNVSFLQDPSSDWLYERLSQAVKHANGINFNKTLYGLELLQYTEYDSSYAGFYGPHVDETKSYTGMRRSLSFSLQLSHPDTYTGGEVLAYNGDTTFEFNKAYGSITFFDSGLMHEVLPIKTGIRKSLVGWVLGPRV